MLNIGAVRWKGRCSRHPRYNPDLDGEAGIVGGCERCAMLLDIYNHHSRLVRAIREFGSRGEARGKFADEMRERQMSLLDAC